MKNRNEKQGINRIVNNNHFHFYTSNAEAYFAQMEEMRKIAKKKDEEIKFLDKKYAMIVNVVMKEIEKRNINVDAPDFNEKMEEILQTLTQGRFYTSRFKDDNINDVRNAILRRVNEERRKNGNSRDE